MWIDPTGTMPVRPRAASASVTQEVSIIATATSGRISLSACLKAITRLKFCKAHRQYSCLRPPYLRKRG